MGTSSANNVILPILPWKLYQVCERGVRHAHLPLTRDSLHMTQLLGSWLYFYDKQWFYAFMALTKQHYAILVITVQQWWSPLNVRVSWDKSVRGQIRQTEDGRLETDFPERLILIANHQVRRIQRHVSQGRGQKLKQCLSRSIPTGSTFGG